MDVRVRYVLFKQKSAGGSIENVLEKQSGDINKEGICAIMMVSPREFRQGYCLGYRKSDRYII